MGKVTLRGFMLARLLAEKNEIKEEIQKWNRTLQSHIKLENRVRHSPKEKFEELLASDPELAEQFKAVQLEMEDK